MPILPTITDVDKVKGPVFGLKLLTGLAKKLIQPPKPPLGPEKVLQGLALAPLGAATGIGATGPPEQPPSAPLQFPGGLNPTRWRGLAEFIERFPGRTLKLTPDFSLSRASIEDIGDKTVLQSAFIAPSPEGRALATDLSGYLFHLRSKQSDVLVGMSREGDNISIGIDWDWQGLPRSTYTSYDLQSLPYSDLVGIAAHLFPGAKIVGLQSRSSYGKFFDATPLRPYLSQERPDLRPRLPPGLGTPSGPSLNALLPSLGLGAVGLTAGPGQVVSPKRQGLPGISPQQRAVRSSFEDFLAYPLARPSPPRPPTVIPGLALAGELASGIPSDPYEELAPWEVGLGALGAITGTGGIASRAARVGVGAAPLLFSRGSKIAKGLTKDIAKLKKAGKLEEAAKLEQLLAEGAPGRAIRPAGPIRQLPQDVYGLDVPPALLGTPEARAADLAAVVGSRAAILREPLLEAGRAALKTGAGIPELPMAEAEKGIKRTLKFPLTEAQRAEETEAIGAAETAYETAKNKLMDMIETSIPVARGIQAVEREAERSRRAAPGIRAVEAVKQGTMTATEAMKRARAALRGEMPTAGVEFQKGFELTRDDLDVLGSRIMQVIPSYFSHTAVNLFEALENLTKGKIPTKSEMEGFQLAFGPDVASLMNRLRPALIRNAELGLQVMDVFRPLMTWGDALPLGWQLWWQASRHPKVMAENLVRYFGFLANTDNALASEKWIQSQPHYSWLIKSNVYQAPVGKTAPILSAQLEEMAPALWNKLPVLNRWSVGFPAILNRIRAQLFYNWANGMVDRGIPFEEAPDTYRLMGRFFTRSTGRGTLGPMENIAPVLQAIQFSPRLWLSAIQTPASLLTTDREVLKQVATSAAAAFGSAMTIATAIKFWNHLGNKEVDVETDWRSSRFGQVRWGNTYYSLFRGYEGLAKYLGQATQGKFKEQGTGRIQKTKGFWETTGRYFFESKASPQFGGLLDALTGEDFLGRKFKIERALAERLTFLFAQDLIDAALIEGPTKIYKALPSAFAYRSSTYRPGKTQEGFPEGLPGIGKFFRSEPARPPALRPTLRPPGIGLRPLTR